MDPNDPKFINKQLERIAIKEAVDRLKQNEMDNSRQNRRRIRRHECVAQH